MAGGGITRRKLLLGGGAGVGLVIAYAVWPRDYVHNLVEAPGETAFNGFLKIGEDGRVTVIVGQAEMGQGVYTALPQILADELGADWRTVAVEPAPIGPLYANDFLLEEAARQTLPHFLSSVGAWAAHELATRTSLMMTGGSTSIRGFEQRYREAGAVARTLLCMAAAERWGVDWQACDTSDGFVVRGEERLRFGGLAMEAAAISPPAEIVLRERRTLSGRNVPRIDLPAKVDGSARYAADVRLPDMLFASVRRGPVGSRLAGIDTAAADRVRGVVGVFSSDHWAAAAATNTWAAERGVAALAPRFTRGSGVDDAAIERALQSALAGSGVAFAEAGNIGDMGGAIARDYRVALAAHAPIEPTCATARYSGDRLELWLPTQAPGLARAAAARAAGLSEGQVTVYPMLLGGSFGGKIETDVAEQAAIVAVKLRRPVQLQWTRAEESAHDRFRPPAIGRLRARLDAGRIAAWSAAIATPSSAGELMDRIMPGNPMPGGGAEASAVDGARPPYGIPNLSVVHHPAKIGVPTGMWRSVAHSYTAFFTESFMDELAAAAGVDPLSFRIGLLGGAPRLARCLSAAATLGGWEGAASGGQGLSCHSAFGSHVAMLVEARPEGGRVKVARVAVAVDCGRIINPDLVRQQIEGGVIFGLAAALGGAPIFAEGRNQALNFDTLTLPMLADTPEILIELIASREAPGGVGEIAVPLVGPALANALASATGRRFRNLPIAL